MLLSAYLRREGLSLGAFAKRLRLANARSVHRYVRGRVPRPSIAQEIVRLTGGAVRLEDLYRVPRRHPESHGR